MVKQKLNRDVEQSFPSSNPKGAGLKVPPNEMKDNAFRNHVEWQSAAIRAICHLDIEHLLADIRLFRSYFKKEELQTPLLQFSKTNLLNLSIKKTGKSGQYEVMWKVKDDDLAVNLDDGRTVQVIGNTLSAGMTSKTTRLPKHDELLLSVHGSPLGVYKEEKEPVQES